MWNITSCVEKTSPRARQKVSAVRIWPAGRTLPTPGLDKENADLSLTIEIKRL